MPALVPANNPVVKANASGAMATASSPQHPGAPVQPQAQPAAAMPGFGRMPGLPSWLLTGEGPITSRIPKRISLKASPAFPQPMAGDQVGAFPKQADLLPGGSGDNKPDKKFNVRQLRLGVQHEKEHTSSKAVAKEIAKDHLTEHPKFYTSAKAANMSKIRWLKPVVHGDEAFTDLERYMRKDVVARTNAREQLEDLTKKAEASEPIEAFAAAFYVGCALRGYTPDQIKTATARASRLDPAIAEQLSGLTDDFFSYVKQALVDRAGQPLSIKPPAPKAAPAATPAPAAMPESLPETPAAPAPAAASSTTTLAQKSPSFARRVGNLGFTTGGLGGLASSAFARLAGPSAKFLNSSLQQARELPAALQQLKTLPEDISRRASESAMDVLQKRMASPDTKKLLEDAGASVATGAKRSLGDSVTDFMSSIRNSGPVKAITDMWSGLSPAQRWSLLAAVGGPMLGLGAAAMGRPGLGLGIGALGLGAGMYGLHSGGSLPSMGNVIPDMYSRLFPAGKKSGPLFSPDGAPMPELTPLSFSADKPWSSPVGPAPVASGASELARASGEVGG